MSLYLHSSAGQVESLKINKLCQSCQQRPRTAARLIYSGNGQHWLLCDSCVRPNSKFSLEEGAKEIIRKLDETYLRDVESGKAFTFRLVCSDGSLGNKYLYVPGLRRGHSEVEVWDLVKGEAANGWWDWPIIEIKELKEPK